MKVLFLCYGHYDSGLELYKYLAEKLDVTLAIQIEGGFLRQSVLDIDISDLEIGLHTDLSNSNIARYIYDLFDINLEKFVIIKYNSLSLRDIKNFKVSLDFANWVKRNNYDIVHYYGSSLTWVQQAIFLRKIKRIYTVHDYIPHTGEIQTKGNGYQYKFYMKVITRNPKNHFVLLSKKMLEEFSHYYNVDPERCDYIHFGPFYSYLKFAGDVETQQNTILFFGRISAYKGIEYLLEAIELIKKEYSNLKVIIAGSGKFYFDINKYLNDPTYEFYNKYIDNNLLATLLQRCSFVVCPYTDATQSGVVMTAYAFNKPVIATDVGSFREQIMDGITGLLCEPRNTKSLADKIQELLNNKDLMDRMILNIKNLATTKFSWDLSATKLFEFYNKILNKRN